MKKKKRFNRKISFTIVLFFAVCGFMATNSWAAKEVKFYKANANDYIRALNEKPAQGLGNTFGLTQDEDFKLIRQGADFNSVTHSRYSQTYKGIPVWGMETVVSRDHTGQVVGLHGAMVLNTPKDIPDIPGTLDPQNALKRMEKQHKAKDANAVWSFSNEKYGTYIYVDKKAKANLCYVVSFFADNEKGNPSRPLFVIDVKSGKVMDSFNMLTNAVGTGPGGNGKVGLYEYGTDYPGFCVTQDGAVCTMNCTNVKTVDLNHGTSGSTAFSFTCPRNTHEPINGGYCPMNDAQYFGQVVCDTYTNWYGVPVLPFQLVLKCHYGTNYENVFWDGTAIYFGDGSFGMYPPETLDIIAHEASHGFTQNHSGLIYSGQSGGINESYSDMAGEAAKFYMRSANDFMFGYDIMKSPTGAFRYLYDPPLDGVSIDHVGEYYEGMPVHYSSGIFNKAFYLIATSPGWTTRMAFDIFIKANMDYWTPGTTFQQGAEAAAAAALDYGYSDDDVTNAFAVVGINLTCQQPTPGPIVNPGFETGNTSGWTVTGNVGVTSGAHTGSYAVSLNGAGSSVEQVVANLCGNATYTVSCWGKARSTASVYLGVKNYGGAQKTVQFTDAQNFVYKSITFTTGADNTSVTLFFIKQGSKYTGIGDDFAIVKN